MNIAFRADGSNKIGLGHLMRCSSLANSFLNKGHKVCFYCHNSKSSGIKWLQQKKFDVVTLNSDTLELEASELYCELLANHIDVIFIDSYWLDDNYFSILKSTNIITVAIDDEELYNYDCDIIINCSLGSEDRLYRNCKVKKKLLGGKYSILRDEFSKTPISTPKRKVETLLVTMGGSDVNNFTPYVLESLSDFSDLDIIVLCGPLMQNKELIENFRSCHKSNIIIYQNPPNVAELMSKCDIAISSAGGTARELFSLGVVSLFVLQAENQIPFKSYLDSRNLDLCLGYYTDVDRNKIYNATNSLINDYNKRKSIHEQIIKLANPNGADNITSLVLAYVEGYKTSANL